LRDPADRTKSALTTRFEDLASAMVAHMAGLAEGVPVDLSDVLTGLDEAIAALVADVIVHAAGHRRPVLALGDGILR